MPPGAPPDEWEWLLRELDRINAKLDDIPKLRDEIATLKVKSGLWGAVGACIPVVVMLAYNIWG